MSWNEGTEKNIKMYKNYGIVLKYEEGWHKVVSNVHEDKVDPLTFLILSKKRRNLLLFLRKGPKTLREIREALNVTSSGIIPQLRKMEARHLISKDGSRYMLTQMGSIIAEHLSRLEGTLNIFEYNPEFWAEHDICGIPEEFHLRLHKLGNYEIFMSTPTNIFIPHEVYIKNLLKSKWVKGVSPVLHPEYPEAILKLVENGKKVSIIVTEDVMEELLRNHSEELKEGLNYANAKLMVCDGKIGVAFTVTDFFFSMRLFLRNGTYDFYQNLISFERSALKFGEELFSYYEKHSRVVEVGDL